MKSGACVAPYTTSSQLAHLIMPHQQRRRVCCRVSRVTLRYITILPKLATPSRASKDHPAESRVERIRNTRHTRARPLSRSSRPMHDARTDHFATSDREMVSTLRVLSIREM